MLLRPCRRANTDHHNSPHRYWVLVRCEAGRTRIVLHVARAATSCSVGKGISVRADLFYDPEWVVAAVMLQSSQTAFRHSSRSGSKNASGTNGRSCWGLRLHCCTAISPVSAPYSGDGRIDVTGPKRHTGTPQLGESVRRCSNEPGPKRTVRRRCCCIAAFPGADVERASSGR
jgi:hypothetical protein